MTISIFLSHNSADKQFTKKLAKDLEDQGIRCWLDEAEIRIGDSLVEKIREGIDEVDYLAVVLSPESVNSEWVRREVDVAMNQEILGRNLKVLPVLHKRCELPGFLLGKRYADFTAGTDYLIALESLVRSVGVVFNRMATSSVEPQSSIQFAAQQAASRGLRILGRPFHRPFQYIGQSIAKVERAVGRSANQIGNIIVETPECKMLLEAEGNFIAFVELDLLQTLPHFQNEPIDTDAILGVVSINPAELELVRSSTFSYVFNDHRKKLQVSVQCAYDGAPISVSFGGKYYGT